MQLIRLSVNMNQETAEALTTIKDDKKVTLTEAVRRCISITTYIYDEIKAGRQIISQNPDGSDRRELIPF